MVDDNDIVRPVDSVLGFNLLNEVLKIEVGFLDADFPVLAALE